MKALKVNADDYKVGNKVICILNNRSNLTIGKEYTIQEVDTYGENVLICLKNDDLITHEYNAARFVTVATFRQYTIDQILKS